METLLYILAGVATGSLLTYFITRSWLTSAHNRELIEKSNEQTRLREQIATMNAKLEAEKESLKAAQDAMLEKFSSAASAALGQNSEQFLRLAKTQFEAHKTEAGTELDQRKNAISEMLGPMKEVLEKYNLKVEELGKNSNLTFGQVREMLSSLQVTSTGLQKETSNLATALKNPQTRGRWGEITLRNIVELTGMLDHCDFNEQVYKEGEDDTIKPDMLVNLPNSRHVVVDSKVPLKAFMEAIEASDEKTRNELFAAHSKSVRNRMTELSRKNYWSQFKDTLDLVVLFVPVESALNAALLTDKDLFQDALSKRIILAAPSTVFIILKSYAMSWQQHNITVNATEIMELSRELHERLLKFNQHLGNIGSGLKDAVRSYNEAIGSYEGRLLVTGRKLEDLDAKSNKEKIRNIGTIDDTIRALDVPDET